ncbi:MAG: hypothetical protein ACOCUH_03245, partial [Bacteriovoracia bacterium]
MSIAIEAIINTTVDLFVISIYIILLSIYSLKTLIAFILFFGLLVLLYSLFQKKIIKRYKKSLLLRQS